MSEAAENTAFTFEALLGAAASVALGPVVYKGARRFEAKREG